MKSGALVSPLDLLAASYLRGDIDLKARGLGRKVVNPAGTKLLKRFNKSGNRALHASKPQFPCYGRRSERRAAA